MAEEAEKSQWSWWGKRLAWVIQESLIALSGAGALRWLGKGVVETTKLMTSFAADVGFNAAESAGADVLAVRAAIDAKTGELAKELKKHTVDFIGDLEIGTFHANWLGEHKDNLTELVLFRIPPAVPRIPAADVRAAVAQAVVGFLYGEGPALPQYEHVLAMELDPDLLAPFLLPLSSRHAHLKTSRILLGELYGRQIKDMPNVPLSITLASSQNPVDVVRASLGLPEPSPPNLGGV